jgi:Tol biopolymer transport system component
MELLRSGLGRLDWMGTTARAALPQRSWDLDEGKFWGLFFSRDGRRLAYAAHENGCEIRVASVDGREKHVVATALPDELISEVHGFSVGDEHVLYGVAKSGAEPELWAADIEAAGFDTTRRMAKGYFFAGWADAHDAIYVWERATGTRRTYRIGFEGRVTQVHSLRMDRTVALDPDGLHLYYSEKNSSDVTDRRFSIYRSELDGAGKQLVADVSTSCFARRLAIVLSPDGRFIHASAVGLSDSPTEEILAFDLVVSVDGRLRRTLPVKGWASAGRAIVMADGRRLQIVDLKTGAAKPLIDQPVDHFAVSPDGRRLAYASNRRLTVTGIA